MDWGSVPDDWEGPGAPLIVVVEWLTVPFFALAVYVVARMMWEHVRVPAPFAQLLAWLVSLGFWEAIFFVEHVFGQFPGASIGRILGFSLAAFVGLTILFTASQARAAVDDLSAPTPLITPEAVRRSLTDPGSR